MKQHELKPQLAALYHTIDKRIMRSINKRGYAVKESKQVIMLPNTDSNSHQQLMKTVRLYDIATYFQYNPGRKDMKLRYKIASKLYRTMRDMGVKGSKKAYRIAKMKKYASN